MAYLDLKNSVIRLSPNQISATLAGEVVNAAYTRAVRARNWTSTHNYQVITLNAPYTTGTVTTVRGNAVVNGVGTGWTIGTHENRMFQVGNSVPIRVVTISSATVLTLAQAWAAPAVAGSAHELFDNRFSLGSNVERVLELVTEGTQLERTTTAFLNRVDPTRVQRDTPRFYAEFETRPPGTMRREIEVWPVPHENIGLGLWYKALPPALSADGDVPVLPEEIIEHAAQSEGCRILYGRTGDQNWISLGETYEKIFRDDLAAYMAEDMISQSEPPAPAATGAAT